MSELNNYYRTEQEAAQDKLYERTRAEQDEAYNAALTMIDSQSWNTTDELAKYLDGYRDKVSDTQMMELENRLNFYRKNTDQIAADDAYREAQAALALSRNGVEKLDGIRFNANPVYNEDKDKDGNGTHYKKGDNFTITDGTNTYDVQYGEYLTGDDLAAVVKAVGNQISDGEVFKYGDTLYMLHNGKYYEIKGRATNKDGYNALFSLYK